uniref:Bm8572 n=2 Tax=Brugia malayi TaxID=6279 RepID=A0A1I9GC59_BRUMA|nr:Bm8572 [Brugia malayi]
MDWYERKAVKEEWKLCFSRIEINPESDHNPVGCGRNDSRRRAKGNDDTRLHPQPPPHVTMFRLTFSVLRSLLPVPRHEMRDVSSLIQSEVFDKRSEQNRPIDPIVSHRQLRYG